MTAWSDVESRVLAAVDEQWALERLRELVALPSITGSAAESDAQHRVADWLADLGLDVDLWPIDVTGLSADPEWPGMEVARSQAWGCVGSTAGGRPALALSGHIDVVPAGDRTQWTSDPFEPTLRGGALVGRGTCDMKGGLVAAITAVAAVVRAGVPLVAPLALHSVVSEEDGGLGALATIRRGHLADTCVIPEPTAGAVLTANAGSLSFRLTVPGRSAHGALRMEGVSAVDAFLPVHRALLGLEQVRNADPDPRFAGAAVPYALSIGKVRAGDWASTVPDQLVAEGRYGVQLGEPVAVARAAFERCVSAACAEDRWLAEHPVRVNWNGGQFGSGVLPAGHRLLGDVQAAVRDVTGVLPAERAGTYGSDLRQYTAAGVATVHYGPGDPRSAHIADESVPVADVVSAARALALLAVRTCGARRPGRN